MGLLLYAILLAAVLWVGGVVVARIDRLERRLSRLERQERIEWRHRWERRAGEREDAGAGGGR